MRRFRVSFAHAVVLLVATAVALALATPAAGATSSRSVQSAAARRLLVVRFRPHTPRVVVREVLLRARVRSQWRIRRLRIDVVRVERRQPVRRSLQILRRAHVVAYARRQAIVRPPRPKRPVHRVATPRPAAQPALETAPAGPPVPNDPQWSQQWSATKLLVTSAWAAAGTGDRVIVATIDSGVDAGHPDLAGVVVSGHDFVRGNDDPRDDNGHGTAVAGVIAARADNGVGVAGICQRCAIMPIKVSDSNGRALMSDVAAGIVWATDHGARVINVSLGGGPDDAVASAVHYAHDRGVVIVAAAGNAGNADLVYPAAYPEVIAVAGSDESDHLYGWSTYGSWVRVAAPGCNVTTTLGASYGLFCGTSSAAPVVAALAALALAAAPTATLDAITHALLAGQAPVAGSELRRVDALATVRDVLAQ